MWFLRDLDFAFLRVALIPLAIAGLALVIALAAGRRKHS